MPLRDAIRLFALKARVETYRRQGMPLGKVALRRALKDFEWPPLNDREIRSLLRLMRKMGRSARA
jgi:hypothetical protein